MKSLHILFAPIFLAANVQADILSDLSPFFSSSGPDFDTMSIEPDSAVDNADYVPFSPADSDFGVQQILGTYRGHSPVNVSFDTSLGYTENAPGEIPFDDEPSWFSASRLAVGWSPRIAYGWFADIGIAQDLLRFEGDKASDYENFEPYLGIVKSIPELDDLFFFTRYEYQRITSGSLSASSYSAQRIRTGLQKDLVLAPRHQLSAGVDAAFDLTADADTQERNTYSADLGYTYWLADKLSATLSWTGSMWDFKDGGRDDTNHIVGLELTWAPCKDTIVYTNVFYSNHSSDAAADANEFEAWQSGIGFGLNYSF